MDTQTQVERLIELAIVQRTELRQLVEQLPQLRDHLNAEIERTFEEVEPQIRVELEEFCRARATDEHAKTGAALAAKVDELSKKLEATTSAKYSVLLAERAHNVELERIATEQVAQAANQIPQQVKAIVADELSRFPRAGEIDQLRKEFATPAGLNPRGKWQSGQTYQRLDVVSYNGNSYIANGTTSEKPSVTSSAWTINAARGVGGGGPSSLNELTQTPTDGSVLIGSGTSWVTSTLTAGAGISIANAAGSITITGTGGGTVALNDGTAAAPSLNFTNDPDTGLYWDAANTLGIATGGVGTVIFSSSAGIGKIKAHGTRVLALEAGTGNTNITLTPSGTGVLAVTGAATISSSTASTGVGVGALQVAGGAYFGASSWSADNFTFAGSSGRTATFKNGIIGIHNSTVEMVRINADATTLYFRNQVADSNFEFYDGNNNLVANFGGAGSIPLAAFGGRVTVGGAFIGTPSARSGAGAVAITALTASLTSTGVAQAITLANGTAGQILNVVHVVDGGSMVLTPSTKIGFSTVTFTNVGDSVALVYTAAGWAVIGSYLAVIAP